MSIHPGRWVNSRRGAELFDQEALGSELIPSVSIDDLAHANWTTSNLTVDDANTVTFLATSGSVYHTSIAVTEGTVYKHTVTHTFGTATTPKTAIYDLTNAAFIEVDVLTNDGTETIIYFVAPPGCSGVRIYGVRASGAAAGTMDIDGLSLKEVTAPDKSIPENDPWPALAGSEMHTDANAASDPNGNEADATTGWSVVGTPSTFASATEGTETGSYSIHCVVDANGEGFNKEFTTVANQLYRLKFDSKRGGGDAHRIDIGVSGDFTSIYTQTGIANASFAETVVYFTASGTSTFIQFREAGGNDDADFYVDNLSLRPVQISWTPYGTNTIEIDETEDSLKVTYVDSASGAHLEFSNAEDLSSNLTVGETYLVTFDAKTDTGDTVQVVIEEEDNLSTDDLTDSWVAYEIVMRAAATTTDRIRFSNMAAGEVAYIRNLSIKPLYGKTRYDSKVRWDRLFTS